MAASLDEQTGAFTKASEAIVTSQLLDAIDDSGLDQLGEQMETYGLSVADVTTAILEQGDAYDEFKEKIIEANSTAAGVSDEAGARRLAETSEVWQYVEEQIEAQRLAQEAILAVAEAERERYLALDEGARSHQRYKESIMEVADETLNMSDRVRALKDALDELDGGVKTQEERDRELATTQRDLNSWFENNAEAIGEMDGKLIDLSTGMPSHTELGDDLSRMLQGMGDAAHEAAIEIRDQAEAEGWSTQKTQEAITDAYEPYIATLQDLKEQGHLTQGEVDALTESIIGVPSITAFAITHGDTVTRAELEVLELIDKIEATPDKSFTIDDDNSTKESRQLLADLGYDIENIKDGEFKVTPKGIDAAEKIVSDFVNKPRTIQVNVETLEATGSILRATQQPGRAGRGGVPYAPGKEPRFHGGIDVKGMKAGGLTGPSVMDVAQFVKPGDIRFAGDRSDVDEAWIPLDGSPRSLAILMEAIERMPGFDPIGMATGGITGILTPPQVEGVEAPDTEELQQVWQDAMAVLEESTRNTFGTIEADTTQSQQTTVEATSANMAMMRDITATHLAFMVAATATNMATMGTDTARHTAGMRDTAGTNLASMDQATTLHTANMRATSATEFLAMQTQATNQTGLLHANTAREFRNLHAEVATQAAGLRTDSDTEFTSLRVHGVDAARDLRAGVVSEIGQARSPFTSRVNDLVQVMREFSDAITDAYGDMGVTIGKPNRISAATGTILPGFNPGVDNHIFHSPTGGILELSGGEGISRPEVVQAMGPGAFNALNAAARSGGVRGVQQALSSMVPRQAFSDGGILDGFTADAKTIGADYKTRLPDNWLRPAGRNIIDQVVDGMGEALAAMFSGAGWVRPTTGRVTSNYGPRWGTHHAGMDIAAGHGTPVVAPTAARILETGTNIGPGRTGEGILAELMGGMYSYFGHNPVGGIRVRPGDLVAPGQRIGAQGSTGNVTGAHLHWEVHQGQPWNDINPHPFWDAAGSGGSGVTMPGGGNDMWTGVIMQALRLVGLPTTPAYVNAWLTQGRTESGLNPRAVQQVHDINSVMGNHARGIVQVIPPTFAAYSLPGMKDIFNPLHNFAAGMNYAKNRYGAAGMLNVIGKGRGYEHGTDHALPGWAWVGEAGPELIRFRGGEQVLSHAESKAAVAGGSKVELSERSLDRFAKRVATELRQYPQVNINHPTTRDTDELARKAAAAFEDTLIHAGQTL